MLNEDYKDILKLFTKHEVKFLVVGAYALAAHGIPRATGDMDFWIEPSLDNSRRTYEALAEFGAPLTHIGKDSFAEKGVGYQIGVVPRRVDVITKISGVEFTEAYACHEELMWEGLRVPYLSLDLLIKNKKASGRPKDLVDLDALEEHDKKSKS